MEQDPKQLAIYLSRTRAVLGLLMIVFPGLAARLWFGRSASTGPTRALARVAGVRDVVLGVGTLTALNETDHGPEWLSMCAAADAVDTLALALGSGLGVRSRLSALSAAGAAAVGLKLSRDLADARDGVPAAG